MLATLGMLFKIITLCINHDSASLEQRELFFPYKTELASPSFIEDVQIMNISEYKQYGVAIFDFFFPIRFEVHSIGYGNESLRTKNILGEHIFGAGRNLDFVDLKISPSDPYLYILSGGLAVIFGSEFKTWSITIYVVEYSEFWQNISPQLASLSVLRDREGITSNPELFVGEIRLSSGEAGGKERSEKSNPQENYRRYVVPIAVLAMGGVGVFWGIWRAQASFAGHSLRVWLQDIGIIIVAGAFFAGGVGLIISAASSSSFHVLPYALGIGV